MKQFLRLFFTEAWQTQPSAGRWPLALRRGLYLIGMNAAIQLPFWVAERFYSFQRPLFNYDLVIALLGFCVSAWLGWGLLRLLHAVEVPGRAASDVERQPEAVEPGVEELHRAVQRIKPD